MTIDTLPRQRRGRPSHLEQLRRRAERATQGLRTLRAEDLVSQGYPLAHAVDFAAREYPYPAWVGHDA